MKKNVALIFGGRSAEHEVSINSARNIYNAFDLTIFNPVLLGVSKQGTWYKFSDSKVFEKKSLIDSELKNEEMVTLISFDQKPFLYSLKNGQRLSLDCAFPIIHGTMGEDGTIQGFFKMVQLPFVGCGVLSSSVGMDKEFAKRLLTEAGIRNSKFLVLRKENPASFKEVSDQLGIPFFIKPANAGSSVGVHKIKNAEDFQIKLSDAFLYDHKVLAEEFIDGAEIECSVMGLNQSPKASLPGQLKVNHEFYSYEAKYLDEKGADIIIPAKISESHIEQIRKLAIKTYKSLGCDGLTRVDFFISKSGEVIVNEINTLPGFTKISMYPKMWEATGIKYQELITELIQLALAKASLDNELKLSFD